uniref:GEM-like protein 5 n=1 Tax=Erigeron canadensis TaxID=72917 RepID=UPI001CB8B4A0|nr:GEM-like protein 5 [Erigeron canadensis]
MNSEEAPSSPVRSPLSSSPSNSPPHNNSSSSDINPPSADLEYKYWGTNVMGVPVPPSACATYDSIKDVAAKIPLPPVTSTLGTVYNKLNNLGIKDTVTGVWGNLKVGESMRESAKGKVKVKARSITEGGKETFYKHNFTTFTDEKLFKTFACYLETKSSGRVAGTLYLSDIHVSFCSDQPLQLVQPNTGVESWLYYKVQIALNKLVAVKPIEVTKNKQPEKSITLSTIDGQDFKLMGFVKYEKASKHLLNSMHEASLKSKRLTQ